MPIPELCLGVGWFLLDLGHDAQKKQRDLVDRQTSCFGDQSMRQFVCKQAGKEEH
jgi:hypothetical protein